MAYSLSPLLKPRFFVNATNKPLVGGKLYTYLAETTTPATTYSDDTGTPNTNPIILDANGECNLYLDDDISYRLILKDANDVTYFDKDRVSSIGGGDYKVLTFNTIDDLRLKIGSAKEPTAQTSGYYVAGDGGGNSFYWDATSSATDNGGTIIKPTYVSGAGRWLAVNTKVINARQFGAHCDSFYDDIIFLDNSVSWLTSLGGGTLVFDAISYVSRRLKLSSNITIDGQTTGGIYDYTSWADLSNYQVITALRDDTSSIYTNIVIKNMTIRGKYAGGSSVPTHSNDSSALELEYCDNCTVDNVSVIRSNDACIRMSGYKKGIASFTVSLTNPDFGFSNNNRISNCRVTGGYIGIELVGGARASVFNNIINDSYVHGIRLAGGGWDSEIFRNTVVNCANGGGFGSAIYVDGVKNTVIRDNNLNIDASGNAAISIGLGENNTIENNICKNLSITDSVFGSGSNLTTGLIIAKNTVNAGSIIIYYCPNAVIDANIVYGGIRAKTLATVSNNQSISLVIDAAGDVLKGGGKAFYVNNRSITTGLFLLPSSQSTIIGSATSSPSSGTFSDGNVILNSSPASGRPLQWVYNATLSKWLPVYGTGSDTINRNIVDFENSGISTSGKQLTTFTASNETFFVLIEVMCVATRAPASSAGTSRVIKKTFSLGRNAGSDVVITNIAGAGDYNIVSTTNGGANNAADPNILLQRAGAESSSSPQTIKISADFPATLQYVAGTAKITGSGVGFLTF